MPGHTMTHNCETCVAFATPERPEKPTLCVPGRLRNHDVPEWAGQHHVRADQGESCPAWEAKETDAMTMTRDEAIKYLETTFYFTHDPLVHEAIVVLTPEPGADRVQAALDARRYRRLRILGAAPAYTNHLRNGNVMRFNNLDTFIDDDIEAYPSRGEAEEVLSSTRQMPQPEGQGDCIAAGPEDDEWIEWRGGVKCPVPAGARTKLRFRDNNTSTTVDPELYRWEHQRRDSYGDIIAYRIMNEAPGHTDLMVSPEAIDEFMAKPENAWALDIANRVGKLEEPPVWTKEKERLFRELAVEWVLLSPNDGARVHRNKIMNAAFLEKPDGR